MKPQIILATPLSGCISGIEAVAHATLKAFEDGPWEMIPLDTATARRNSERGIATPRGCWLMAKMMMDLHRMIRQHEPNAIWIQCARNRLGFLKFTALFLVAKLTCVKVIAKVGGGDFDLFYQWLSLPSRRVVHRVLSACDAILVEADCLRRQFHELVPESKVRWAYLGIDNIPSEFPRRPITRSPNLLYIGHVSKAKGVVDLLDAIPRIQARHPDVRLTILGEHIRKERSVLHIADPHGAWQRIKVKRDNVDMPGLVVGDEKAKAFKRADVFVFPSYSEGFPVAVLEAAAAGLPIVCTPVGALPEVLTSEANCKFVPVGSPVLLADAVNELLDSWNGLKRMYMGHCNWSMVRERFMLSQYRDGVVRALADIMEGR